MNILRLVYEWPPPWDGLAPGPFELTRAQASLGHKVRVLCGGWPRHPVEPLPDVKVRRLPSALPRLSLFGTTAPTALAWTLRWRGWADVIHGHGHLPVWYHLWRRAREDHTPYVLHLHITAAGREAQARARGHSVDLWTQAWEWPLHKLSDRVGCQVADSVICTSESVREEAVHFYGADPKKLHVVPNGVNTDLFSPQGPTARERYAFASDDRVVLFVGVLNPRKRPDLLIEALQRLPSTWKLLIAGRGPMEKQLRRLAERLGVAGRVRFGGYVPYPELPAIYRAADVLALPSEYEGFPKVVVEALACGVPVVAGGFTVGDSNLNTAIIPFDMDADLSQAIRESKKCYVDQTIVARYSWTAIAAHVERTYQAIGL